MQELPNVLIDEVEKEKEMILSLNRDQLLAGRNSDGQLLSPGYLQDPYFKTKGQAEAYLRMKLALESMHKSRMMFANVLNFPVKPSVTPNLIVKGNFHDGMFMNVSGDKMVFGSTYEESNDIEQKYDNKVFGLTDEAKRVFWVQKLRETVLSHFKK